MLTVVFHNAGICGEALFADGPGDWERTIDVDFAAVNDATRIAVRELLRTGRGGTFGKTASKIGMVR